MGCLDGKVVIVTGAGRGIGREIALLAARSGGKVVVNDLGGGADGSGADAGPARDVADEIVAAGGAAVANSASVGDPAGADSIVRTALDAFGRVDAVVNNAGILRDRIFHRMSVADFEQVIQVHLMGSFYVSKAAALHFREQQSGAFVHFTSTSGLIGNFGQANYSAAKMGIVGLSKSIALDMAKFNVRSNCIAPWAWTAMTASIPDTPENQPRIEKMKKMEAGKIAPLVVYLVSDRAAAVSGQIFGVRANEIYFFSQSRMIRSVHRSEGWTPEEIAEHAMPAFEASFFPNVASMALTP